MKRGLKGERVVRPTLLALIVEEYSPMKRGLKEYIVVRLLQAEDG